MDLSIIIVSWNVRRLLDACLHSIRRETSSTSYEVIVVDNASSDGTASFIATHHSWVTLIANPVNQGFARANNQGLSLARGRHVLFLNPDTEVIEGTIDRSVAYLNRHREVGVLGIQILNPDRTIQPSVRTLPTFGAAVSLLLKFVRLAPRSRSVAHYLAHDFNYLETSAVEQVMGAFFLVPRRIIDALGPFDERFFVWFEEVDFCRRVSAEGWEVRYWPGAQVIHHHAESFSQLKTYRKQFLLNQSLLHYFRKNRPFVEWLTLCALVPVNLGLTALQGMLRREASDEYPQIGGS